MTDLYLGKPIAKILFDVKIVYGVKSTEIAIYVVFMNLF